jgi:hypothetical protein
MMTMSVEQSVEWELAGETEVLGENMSQSHFIHHRSHMTLPRIDPGCYGEKPATNRPSYGMAHTCRFCRCSWNVQLIIVMSRYEAWLVSPLKTVFISLSNVSGALQRQKGMIVNCHSPWPIKKAVFWLSSEGSAACQWPLITSNVENYLAAASMSNLLSILGNGQQSFLVTSFRLL